MKYRVKTHEKTVLVVRMRPDCVESSGVLTAKPVGRTIVYRSNPRFFLRKELHALLLKIVDAYPLEWKERLLLNRRRPRAKGKPVEPFADIEGKKR